MKKILLFASALAGLFLAASCQQENLEPVQQGNTVTYTVQVPGTISTKAIGATVTAVTELIYEVYRIDADTAEETRLYQKTTSLTNGSATVELELVNNQDFRVLFWAQVPENGVYTTTSLKEVKLATALNANAENYAAFAGQDKITYGDNLAGRTITLERPVAQLNIATSAESLVIGEGGIDQTTVTFKETAVTVEGLSTVYNVADQSVSATTTTFVYDATLPYDNDDTTADKLSEKTISVNNVDYHYVSMNYVGFAQPSGDNVKVTYTIETNEVGTITNTISNVPVKANHRTNIIGNLITSTSDYTVTLSATWPEEETNVEVVSVSTAAGLQEAIDDIPAGTEGNIKLEGDIDLGTLAGMISTKAGENPYGLLIPADKTIILDLNGCTLKQEVECKASYSMIKNQGNLTITGNGTISFNDLSAGGGSEWGSYIIDNTGYLTVENGTIVHLGSTNFTDRPTNLPIQNYAGKVVINGGIISSPSFRSLRDFTAGGEIIINGGQFLGQVWMQGLGAGSSSLTINGGEFNPTAGYDGSSVYITNGTNDVQVSITGGTFNTKIGCADSNKSGVKGCITGGQFKANPSAFVAYGYPVIAPETEGGYYTIGQYAAVAKIGDKEYGSLIAAVAEVEDGQTITLIKDEVFTEANRCDNGGWWDGLAYSGDKSFTIDLGGHTIKQDGSLNDYLIWIKNDGEKANTITFKNGTMDAGTTAYCALATASSNAQKMTINLENINLINNNSNGAVVKFRGGAELNVNAGTVITGKDSYVGIEAVGNNTVVNVYDGAKIYQNGTSSYVGAIIGASYNATLNIYGGEGKSAKCGIIVMSTGATINVSGGEWTANGDGTVAAGNNGVLVSQNNRYESGWACKSVLNVTGGTFKGGYDCWGSGPGQEPDDAQINITGGNFNADPENYVVAGYEVTENAGTYTVDKPADLKELEAAFAKGGNVTLTKDVTLLESIKVINKVTLDLNGKTITAPTSSAFEVKTGGELTVKNGKVVAYESTVRAIGGKVVVESGEYTSTGTAVDSPSTYRYSLDSREGGELIINGGTFKSTNGMINVGSTVTINGGKFENIVEKTMTRHFAYVSALLTINDGEFYGKANPSAGGCFFCGAAETGNIQVNGGKFTSLWTSGSVNKIFESYYGGTINVTGGLFNTDGGIATFVTENTDEATKAAYPYVAK